MTYLKYSKPSSDVIDFKQDFFQKDKELHSENIRLANIYRKQPRRELCKNCNSPLGKIFFTKHSVEYYLCKTCNHLNGGYEDTLQFVEQLYTSPESDYAKYYRSVDKTEYLNRVRKIYNPKVAFLLEALERNNERSVDLSYCDIGAGSGHFVYSIYNEHKLSNVMGYEVSDIQVRLANDMIGNPIVKQNTMEELPSLIKELDSSVISMIGVLEHLRDPIQILNIINENESVRYLYLSLPLFSYSVFFEIANQDNFNRLLSGGHTHLYTQESIEWLCNKLDFELTDQWSFGADAIDMYRFLQSSLQKEKCSQEMLAYFEMKQKVIIDQLQSVFDQNDFCSETHILLKKKK